MLIKALTVSVGLLGANALAQEPVALTNVQQQTSYAVGVETARNLKRQGLDFNQDLVLRGLRDGLAGEKLALSEPKLNQVLNLLRTEIVHQQRSAKQTPAGMNKLRGQAFLSRNKDKEGVMTLPSGLQYVVVAPANGPKPAATNTVEISYRATRLDGTEFLASEPGKPAKFQVKEAFLPALAEALPLMPAGARWKFFIPPQLAFGEEGVGRDVGPNETIQLEVELLTVIF